MLNGFQHEDPDNLNGNVELLKSSELDAVCTAAAKLSKRLCALYPTQREAIDRATDKVYLFEIDEPFYDLLNYAQVLAEETGDDLMKAISQEMEQAFGRAILEQVTIDQHVLPSLPSYSLSVVLVDHDVYNAPIKSQSFTYRDVYEYSDFHQLTDWGTWLDTNQHKPTGNPCGQAPN